MLFFLKFCNDNLFEVIYIIWHIKNKIKKYNILNKLQTIMINIKVVEMGVNKWIMEQMML